jgi:Suppressor of fused protein (SUFU)
MTIIEHLERVFGKSDSVLYQAAGIHVRFWPDRQRPSMGVVCTVGMSDRIQPIATGQTCPSREPRIELFSFCHSADANILAQVLLDLSFYPFRVDKCLFWWQTLPLGHSLASGSRLEAVLLTFPPFSEESVTFFVDEKRRDLVWVIPISASELEFCRTEGVEAFEDVLERTRIDIADIFRQPVV